LKRVGKNSTEVTNIIKTEVVETKESLETSVMEESEETIITEQTNVLSCMKKIKDIVDGYEFNDNQISFLKNLFMKNPLLSSYVTNKYCKLTKEQIMNVLESTEKEAISIFKQCGTPPMQMRILDNNCGKNCNDPIGKPRVGMPDEIKNPVNPIKPIFIPDNPIIPINPIKPIFIPDNPIIPIDPIKPIFIPDNPIVSPPKNDTVEIQKLTIDDRTLYLDDGDFNSNMRADLILSYKNKTKYIPVPRSIPKSNNGVLKKREEKPSNKTLLNEDNEDEHSEEDNLIIPIQNFNPGVITKDDEMKTKLIYKDNKIKKDCLKNKK
jgi:hypothetical protein